MLIATFPLGPNDQSESEELLLFTVRLVRTFSVSIWPPGAEHVTRNTLTGAWSISTVYPFPVVAAFVMITVSSAPGTRSKLQFAGSFQLPVPEVAIQ